MDLQVRLSLCVRVRVRAFACTKETGSLDLSNTRTLITDCDELLYLTNCTEYAVDRRQNTV